MTDATAYSSASPGGTPAGIQPAAPPALSGLLVEFDSPGALVTAAEQVRDAG